jgi:hypothetical protein
LRRYDLPPHQNAVASGDKKATTFTVTLGGAPAKLEPWLRASFVGLASAPAKAKQKAKAKGTKQAAQTESGKVPVEILAQWMSFKGNLLTITFTRFEQELEDPGVCLIRGDTVLPVPVNPTLYLNTIVDAYSAIRGRESASKTPPAGTPGEDYPSDSEPVQSFGSYRCYRVVNAAAPEEEVAAEAKKTAAATIKTSAKQINVNDGLGQAFIVVGWNGLASGALVEADNAVITGGQGMVLAEGELGAVVKTKGRVILNLESIGRGAVTLKAIPLDKDGTKLAGSEQSIKLFVQRIARSED